MRASAASSWPSAASLRANRPHFTAEPINPIDPRWPQRRAASHSAASSAWSCVMISTWLPAGSSPSTSSGTTAWWRCTRATACSMTTRSSWPARESTRCSSTSWRASTSASSVPTCPTPKIAIDGTGRSGSNSSVTSPPQHCTPCWAGARSESRVTLVSGSVVDAAISPRAWTTAACSRLPPPIVPQVRSCPTTIFAPASRGACPRTAITVTSTPGCRARRSSDTAVSQCISPPPPPGCARPTARPPPPRTRPPASTGSPGRRCGPRARTPPRPPAAPPAR